MAHTSSGCIDEDSNGVACATQLGSDVVFFLFFPATWLGELLILKLRRLDFTTDEVERVVVMSDLF